MFLTNKTLEIMIVQKGFTRYSDSSITDTAIEGSAVSVWSEDDVFPTVELMYAYSGTLCAKVTTDTSVETSIELGEELVNAGFSFLGTSGSTKYYRLGFDVSGKISLY